MWGIPPAPCAQSKIKTTYEDLPYGQGGRIANIPDQWAAGAKWSWFMPWYDGSDAANPHADEAWWKAAMEADYVITRDKVSF